MSTLAIYPGRNAPAEVIGASIADAAEYRHGAGAIGSGVMRLVLRWSRRRPDDTRATAVVQAARGLWAACSEYDAGEEPA